MVDELVLPKEIEVRESIRGSLSKAEQKKIIEAFPDTKFDFDKYRYGVKKYPTGDQNVTSKDYTKVLRFIKGLLQKWAKV